MNPFLHVVAEANERRLCSQAKWFSNIFFLLPQDCVTVRAKNCFASVSFEFQLKCTIIRYMGFTIVKTHISVTRK